MNLLRLQGVALILSALTMLLGLLGPQNMGILGPQTTMFFVTISTILFIMGIPGIHTAQPTGWIGLAGIALLELAALIVLGFRFDMVASNLGNSLSLTSAVAGMLGALIIGWLTIREHVFPAWVGWGFLAYGLLNLIAPQFNLAGLPAVLLVFLPILHAVTLFVYGYFIVQKSVRKTANKYGVA